MKYVLDSSVSLRWVLPEPLADKARQLRADWQQGRHELLALEIFVGENANALIKAERQKVIQPGEAVLLLANILKTSPALYRFRRLVPRVMVIASGSKAGFYDCLYVALAERESCELVTADDRLVRNLQAQFPFIVPLAAMP